MWRFHRHVTEGTFLGTNTSNDAVEVKWILLTISNNAECTGSYKECRLAPVEISERLDGGLEDGCRWGFFVLWNGYVSLKYQCSAKMEVVYLMEREIGSGS